MTYKSKFEAKVAKVLGKSAKYEADYIEFVQPEKRRKYLPDFKVGEKTYIEAKGKLDMETRKKHEWIKQQRPDITIYMLFQNAFNKIRKGSPTTYADWAEKVGIEWADFGMGIPKHWTKRASK